MNNCESEEIVEAANIAISNLLPTKSRSLYDIAYNRFKKWCAEKNIGLILGIAGACRTDELVNLTVDDIEDVGSSLIIKIPNTKTMIPRIFVVTDVGNLLELFRKYLSLRPPHVKHKRLFLYYKAGKCSSQPVGKNTMGKIPSVVASYLKLPDVACYTGHCLRRSSATLLADADVDITTIKRHAGWKSTAVAEGYVENSIENKAKIANQVLKEQYTPFGLYTACPVGIADGAAYTYNPKSVMNNGHQETTPMQMERPVYQIEDLNRDTLYQKPYSSVASRCRKLCRSVRPVACLKQTVPLLEMVARLQLEEELCERRHQRIDRGDYAHTSSDRISGMAYGLLGNVPPVVGIYMAFFPVLIYFIFGTSRHVSMGTFAIVCLMTGKVVSQYTTIEILQNGTERVLPTEDQRSDHPTYIVQVATTVTFTVAIIQLAMYILRLGMVSQLLSETLVNGFTCASAFHVVSSQLKDLLGLSIQKRRGNFSFIYTLYDTALDLPHANTNVLAISCVACIILASNNELLKPRLAKITRIPFPIELVAVVTGTVVSYCLDLGPVYGVSVVGNIPKGLPEPALPAFELIPSIFLDSFVITMVSYTITMSMALIFARKLMYEVDSNQELLALGLSNTFGSFFSSMPITASLSRSMIQQAVGGVTQIASVVSCSILLVILLWVGPFFETLPRCVLASIIVVALKGMILQFTSIVRYWRLSKWDAVVWLVTFGTTLFVQIGYGLAAGVAVSLISIFIQGYKPYTCLLGVVPNTDLYLDIKRYKAAREIDGIKIFHYSGGLSFASATSFKQLLVRKTGFDAAAVLRRRVKMQEKGRQDDEEFLTKCLMLDFSGLTFVDPTGVEFLRNLQADYEKLGISMYVAGCSGPVFEVMVRCDKVEKKEQEIQNIPHRSRRSIIRSGEYPK
ncbi:hypothetical protein NQ317_012329 [Molorchus minor]|uniref:Prestin n=1 Tax=Molorchus minor TaxID=1323400 RepID=A0ABQ9IRL6_9CUCU|nr:hypothetical protein NQ317_012329 [Molorchus minor]